MMGMLLGVKSISFLVASVKLREKGGQSLNSE
jgi:hypothetical protein